MGKLRKKIDAGNSHCMQMVHNSHWIVIFIFCVDQISKLTDFIGHCLNRGIGMKKTTFSIKTQTWLNTIMHE